MSMNKYMHPRNIYKTPPSFKHLAIEYPEFRQYTKQDITGKIVFDFRDQNALRTLSRILLRKDFGLDVVIPANKLIPTIPLRLNYLLWIQDLLDLDPEVKTDAGGSVTGIDIGTGASCVYPLIAAKRFNWSMIGTENDRDSLEAALSNVKRNSLESAVRIVAVSGDNVLEDVLTASADTFDFCMCNPPFFSSARELHPFFKARSPGRAHPRNAFVASPAEVVVDGGEVKFITKMILESRKFRDRIRIFTTMIGHKTSLIALKKLLRENKVASFKETEFCQGHTTRWGLAWTFQELDLTLVPPKALSTSKSKPPLTHSIKNCGAGLETVAEIVKKIFNDLQIDCNLVKKGKTYENYVFVAHYNTWSHQRRRNREKKRLLKIYKSCESEAQKLESKVRESATTDVDLTPVPVPGVPVKNGDDGRVVDNSSQNSNGSCSAGASAGAGAGADKNKREKEDSAELHLLKKMKLEDSSSCLNVKGIVGIRKEKEDILIEINNTSNETNREHLHQILQYLKNNIKFDDRS